MKGKNFLKVTGILMIIGGGISCIGYIFVLACTVCVACAAAEAGAAGTAAIAAVAGILACADGIIELIAGIVGVKNCDKPEKAGTCMVLGIIVGVLALISVIMTAASGDSSALSIVISVICSIAVPVLYIIGAILNKKNA